jgi:hypothetical protein
MSPPSTDHVRLRRGAWILADVEIDLDAPSPAAAILPESPGAASAPPPAEPSKAGQADKTPGAPAPAKPEDSDKVIELSRSKRESDRQAKEAAGKVTALEARVAQVEPVIQLFKLAESDPLQFITEIADVVGIDPDRVLKIMAERGAGGDPALSPEDRIAMLERRLADKDKPEKKPEPDAQAGEQARQGFIDSLDATIKAAPEKFPLCGDEASAPEAAFLVMVRHWEAGKSVAGYRPLAYTDALSAVEKTLRAETQRRAERIGMSPPSQNGTPRTGGLSNATMGAVVPVEDRILTDAEIRDKWLRDLGVR